MIKRILLYTLAGAVIVAAYLGFQYRKVIAVATAFEEESRLIFLAEGCDFQGVLDTLDQNGILCCKDDFIWVAEKKKYDTKVKPGRYRIRKGISHNDLVNLLRSGDQEPVTLTIQNERTPYELAGKAASYLMADSISILNELLSESTAARYGFDTESFRSMFLPNSYEFFWTTDAQGFIERMAKEFKRFWNDDRINKAKALGMSQSEVVTLASIVKAECMHNDEAPRIAGVYLNRIKTGIPLQADPTLVYASGDFNLNRVLDIHKQINSPYNTYMYAGLPPGPINYPENVYVDAVLNAEQHSYYYFCAKADFSGYHNFAKSYEQHLVYAREYQRELNKRRIYR